VFVFVRVLERLDCISVREFDLPVVGMSVGTFLQRVSINMLITEPSVSTAFSHCELIMNIY